MTRFLPYKAIVLDMDNTLYDERKYLFAAYESIAEYVAKQENVSKEAAANYLKDNFNAEGRAELLDKFIHHFNLQHTKLNDCLKLMRTVQVPGGLHLYPEIKVLLQQMKEHDKLLCVLTNGNPEQQRNKVRQIDWDGLNDSIEFIYANEFQKKPSPEGIQVFMNKHSLKPSELVMVGDGREDLDAAEAAGLDFIRAEDILIKR